MSRNCEESHNYDDDGARPPPPKENLGCSQGIKERSNWKHTSSQSLDYLVLFKLVSGHDDPEAITTYHPPILRPVVPLARMNI